MTLGAGNVFHVTVPPHTLILNDWVRVLPFNGARAYLDIQNEDAANAVRYQHTTNPFALSLDGTNDLIAIDGLIATVFTANVRGIVRARINRDTGGAGDDTIWSASDASLNEYVKLWVDGSDILKAELRTAAAVQWALESTTAIETAKWLEVKLRHDGTEPKLFINDNEIPVTNTVTTDETAWINDLSNLDVANIGCIDTNGAGNADFFAGDIDYLRVNGADNAHQKMTRIGDWAMDEGTIQTPGATVFDGTSNGFNGTISGATWIARENGSKLAAETGREWGDAIVSPEPLWVLIENATPTTIGIDEGVRN